MITSGRNINRLILLFFLSSTRIVSIVNFSSCYIIMPNQTPPKKCHIKNRDNSCLELACLVEHWKIGSRSQGLSCTRAYQDLGLNPSRYQNEIIKMECLWTCWIGLQSIDSSCIQILQYTLCIQMLSRLQSLLSTMQEPPNFLPNGPLS